MSARTLLRDPLTRLVAAVALLGAAAQALGAVLLSGHGAVADLARAQAALQGARGPVLAGAVLLLTVAADLVAVRVHHGEHEEELTLYGAAVVVGALVLPGADALVVPVAASAVCGLLRRRPLVKNVFNTGNHATATAALVGGVHLCSGAGAGLTLPTVVGLTLGSAAFAAVDLVAVSRVLGVVSGDDPWRVAREGVRLSALEAAGTVALGGTVVMSAWSAPALLPFALAPAAALTFAYRASAHEVEERRRSARLLELSHLLAEGRPADQLLPGCLGLVREAFGADLALVAVTDPDLAGPAGTAPLALDGPGSANGAAYAAAPPYGPGAARPASGEEGGLLVGGPAALTGGLPGGWSRVVRVPLAPDGRPAGAVALATRSPHRPLGAPELLLLTTVVSALGVALRGAAHLRRLREETSKLQAVVDESSDGILVLDGAGLVQLWSPALVALTGTPAPDALGRPLTGVLAVRDGASALPALSPAAPAAVVELTLLRPDGEQRVVRLAHAGAFAPGGGLARDVVLVHDVTREREVERLKADFIATVSHELRTPVTPIKGYADLLRRRGRQMTEAKREECLEIIGDRAAHLARLVEDLLLASRISSPEGGGVRVDPVPADLGPLVQRACGDFGQDGARVAVQLPEAPVRVTADPVRVVQVLTNLVGNALKYSAPGTPVRVVLRTAGGSAHVEVVDRGRGIPADQLPRVFDKFHRVEDPLRMTTGGTGLGLYIARELAVAMGGSLDGTSVLGSGSTFALHLPLAPDPSPAGDGTALPRPRGVVPWPPGPPRPRALPPPPTPRR